jgi:hypothetical protein
VVRVIPRCVEGGLPTSTRSGGRITELLFPNMKGMSLEITEELIARQPPDAQAIIRA